MLLLIVFTVFICVIYCVLIVIFIVGWRNIFSYEPKGIDELDFMVSVIVPCKNEQENILKLITCLANWNKQDPAEVVPAAIKEKVGLFGFTKPVIGPIMPPVDYYLSKSVDSLKGDERNIAVLARAYNNLPLDYIKK